MNTMFLYNVMIILGKKLSCGFPPVAVHGNWTEIQQKADLYARAQIKKLNKQLEAVKKENEEYSKQARYFVAGIQDDHHPQKGRDIQY